MKVLQTAIRPAAGRSSDPHVSSALRTDRELLRKFAAEKSEAAFAEVVRRHASMVHAACMRVLQHRQDAEDAFQAVFWVLACKAGASWWRESVAGWLHEVARRIAMKKRTGRRMSMASSVAESAAQPTPAEPDFDLQAVDEEIAQLPEAYRGAIILCCLEGKRYDEAARELGCTDGVLRGRLIRGKELLRKRLVKRGIGAAAVGLAALLEGMASAASTIPQATIAQTARTALLFANGQTGALSPTALSLAQGALRMILWNRIKLAALSLALLTLLGFGAAKWATAGNPPQGVGPAYRAHPTAVDDENRAEKKESLHGVVRGIDAEKKLLNVRAEELEFDTAYEVPANAEVRIVGSPAKLEDLRKGMRFHLAFAADGKTVEKVHATWPTVRCVLKGIDATKRTITFPAGGDEDEEGAFDITLAIAPEAKALIGAFPIGLDELKVGQKAELELSADRKSAVKIEARPENGEFRATLKQAAGNNLLIAVGSEEEDHDRFELRLPLAPNAAVKWNGQDAKVGDLPANARLMLQLDGERKQVVRVRGLPAPVRDERND
jgi:RNA polymerase sigma factor (sigma-70 family)